MFPTALAKMLNGRALHPILEASATDIAKKISAGEVSSREVVETFLTHIRETNGQLRAIVALRSEEALREADERDRDLREGRRLGPLHGVPITVKECFYISRMSTTVGLTDRQSEIAKEDCILVKRLKRAGAVILGKTNVPQLMISHECDNPLYGRTNNPWNLDRTSGGSSGGEAAAIAARMSPLGLGNDLGGSIRVPASFCGIHGLKPTQGYLTREGAFANFIGMESITSQPGPMARHVEDLELGLRCLSPVAADDLAHDEWGRKLHADHAASTAQMRVGFWEDDGFFPASTAMRRGVKEAVQTLCRRGVECVPLAPPDMERAAYVYLGLLGADGGRANRTLLQKSAVDWRVSRILFLSGVGGILRSGLTTTFRAVGERWLAKLVGKTGPMSAAEYWNLTEDARRFTSETLHKWRDERIDALICPPFGTPAFPHNSGVDLLPAASYAFLFNVLGVPCGVVSTTTVRDDETNGRNGSRWDRVEARAALADRTSSGLPVAVQIASFPWHEDRVLAIMRSLTEGDPTRESIQPQAS